MYSYIIIGRIYFIYNLIEVYNCIYSGNKKILGRFRAVFTNEQKQEIINYLIDMEKDFMD
jgi:hypothetical protein